MRALSLAVVGADYANKRGPTRWFGITLCRPGSPIELRPEPKNKHDEYAIAVYAGDIQIGYLTAERAPWIGRMLFNGSPVVAVFQEKTLYGCVIRVAFDGAAPTLPPPRPEGCDPDYEGDPIPDDFPDEMPSYE